MNLASPKAAFSIQELASLTGLSRHQIRRWLRRESIKPIWIGKKMFFPLASFQSAFPEMWDSIVVRAQLQSDAAHEYRELDNQGFDDDPDE